MEQKFSFYCVCPWGLEELVAKELAAAGCEAIKPVRAGAFFRADLTAAMRACLTSRLASRILLKVAQDSYQTEEDIYLLACRTHWEEHFTPQETLRLDINAARSPLRSLNYALLRAKDGICDRFEHFQSARPSIDRDNPDIRVFVYVNEYTCTFYLDLCGESLFKRGWRRDKGEAPLKENLAAGLLQLSQWDPQEPLLDPFCGSGTIAIEAASIATNTAPGLYRKFLFENFSDFDKDAWRDLKDDALAERNLYAKPRIFASDISTIVIEKARKNAGLAGFSALMADGRLTFAQKDARQVEPPAATGLIVANPPYGEQSNPKSATAAHLMKDFADNLKHHFAGWRAWLLTSDRSLPREMRLSESRKIPLFNGPLECRFFRFDMVAGSMRRGAAKEESSTEEK